MELELSAISKNDDSVIMRKFGIDSNGWDYTFVTTTLDEGQPVVTLNIKTDGLRKGWNIGQKYSMSLLAGKTRAKGSK